jgi:hypothetical protein
LRGVVLLTTGLAHSIYLEGVARGQIVIFAANFLLQVPHLLREKLDRTSTFRANHVVMAAAVVLMLVAGNAVVKRHFTGQAAFGEQFERSVNRGVSDPCISFLHQSMEFVGREMVASFEEGAQNRVALGGLLEPNAFQMAMENLLGFADHLAGEDRLVIDALLEHGGQNKIRIPPGILKMKFIFSKPQADLEYNQRFP